MDRYQQFVKTLCAPNCRLSQVSEQKFYEALQAFAQAAAVLDHYKRAIFYNKPLEGIKPYSRDDMAHAFEVVHSDVLHGIIGIATEAGELVERLIAMSMDPANPEHRHNLIEERGDLEWYAALIDSAIGTERHNIVSANMAKLRARYNKTAGWNQDNALQRDLGAENAALTNGQSPLPRHIGDGLGR